jgi:hypothetical protein
MKLAALAKGALTKALVCGVSAITELPDDRTLPGLVAIRHDGLAAVLRTLELDGDSIALALRGYTKGSRVALEVRAGPLHFAVKAYADDPSLEAELYGVLAGQGLGGEAPVRVPPLLLWDRELRLFAIGWLDGPTGKELIETGRGARAGELAARWVRCAASLPVKLGRPLGVAHILRKARHWVAHLNDTDSTLGPAATSIAARLERAQPPGDEPHLLHGTLYTRHVLDLGNGAGLIDWDCFGQGPQELDAGIFLSSAWQLGLRQESLVVEAARAEAAFLAGTAGLLQERALAWHRAAMLLRLANKISRRPGDIEPARARALLAEAARLAVAAG